jgi:PAT family beta-lactamase induction signal transducer AmpG
MQQIAPGPYKTAHYTFATALMGACMMLTGAISGYIQKAVGFQVFFIIVLVAATPSILATIFAPFHHPDVTKKGAVAA